MKIAVEGCAHGELDKIYEAIQHLEKKDGIKVDLLICCGDFQATRNVEDLRCMAVPLKYQKMCTFYKYYSGEKVAPVLTVFIGGNHEASNYLQELPYGGWVAPRIYYMGYASIVNIAGVRVGGLSGIYKGHDYLKGHFEKPPYTEDTKRSVYHVRNVETFRLKQVQQPVDIFLSHDWPRGIYNFGNVNQLLRFKPFFTDEVKCNSLGSRPCEELLYHLKPTYWFAAHLHVKFAALVPHSSNNEEDNQQMTKFLALDKCLPRRKFLQIVDIPHDPSKSIELEYDLEWLTILHFTNHLLGVKRTNQYMPGPGLDGRWNFVPTKEELDFVWQRFDGNFLVPQNFTQTVVAFDSSSQNDSSNNSRNSCRKQPPAQINSQTTAFCDRLGIDDPMALLLNSSKESSFDSDENQKFCTTLPGYLTPERPGEVTQVSLDDTSYHDSVDDSMKQVLTAETYNKSVSMNCSISLSPMPKHLRLALPSPQNSDMDEPMKDDASSSPVLLRLSHSLPSPRDSDMDEPVCSDTGNSHSSSPEVTSGASLTGSEEVAEICSSSPDLHPALKRFKRRNQALYSSADADS
ncbi:Lariat debranching enzyme [Cryptotermes secundus]|uniref:Lariat debranching enzyme n=2 Tax=Cryptotermes secundus TaxID=105785 RepID=A0A2J7PPC9_9NEOP|nr:lariat debranching enzyme isoform X1 [Cryptotermes secundus]XP_023722492.1 lariat debranching enzyme isoform X1 [Cryptotermes secundus]XP_023722493.1 lariat debranching enzyme isoform X1 [Cryptotermes secundus]XP_023722494.1 lariat debranching enzyme isoform X1 [Cryptotermes secundus]PNF18202.1 Lariat debranching enzyme [Cryptotermes secundus]PNF18203.1 Lariat debranching enzyme [Cryptotermes secundus]PNF18204.1 Lariat debranching enzyme [Cryptotermes secundus]